MHRRRPVVVLPLSSLADPNKLRRVQNEIDINQLLHHPHLVTFLGSFQDEANVYLLQELCCVTLSDLLKRMGHMSELQAVHVLWQVLSAVEYLHGCGVAHRDLKLSNAFLACDGTVKLGDLGLACHLPHPGARRRSTCGSLNWMAPEVLRPGPTGYGLEVDVWALGVMLFTLLVGRTPWRSGKACDADGSTDGGDETQADTTVDRILGARFCSPGPGEGEVGPEALDLITSLLSVDPATRPTLEAVRCHALFAKHQLTPSPTPAVASGVEADEGAAGLLALTAASLSGPLSMPPSDQLSEPVPPSGHLLQQHDSAVTSQPASPYSGLSPAAVDLRTLLGEAGRAALAELAAGVSGVRGVGGSTSGSYMDLSQSEQCSVVTSATTGTGMGLAEPPLQEAAAAMTMPTGAGAVVLYTCGGEGQRRRRPHSYTLAGAAPARLLDQAMRTGGPQTGLCLARHTHSSHRSGHQHHRHSFHRHSQHGPQAHTQQPLTGGPAQAVQPRLQVRASASASVPSPALPSHSSTSPVLTDHLTAASVPDWLPARAATIDSGSGSGGLAAQAQQPQMNGAHPQPRSGPAHGGSVQSYSSSSVCAPHRHRRYRRQPDPAHHHHAYRTVPGGGADQDLSILESGELEGDAPVAAAAGVEGEAACGHLPADGDGGRLRHSLTALETSSPFVSRPAPAGRGAGGGGKALQQAGAGERKMNRSYTYGPSGAFQRSRLSLAAGGSGQRQAGHSHDGSQSLAASGEEAAGEPLPSDKQAAAVPDRLWVQQCTIADCSSSHGQSALRAGRSAGTATVAPVARVSDNAAAQTSPSVVRAAFLSQRPTLSGRRLIHSRSGRNRRAYGSVYEGAIMRSSAAAAGDPDGEDGSSDTARSYADSLEAVLLGGDGRNAAALRAPRRGPAPVTTRSRASTSAVTSGEGGVGGGPASRSQGAAAAVAVVLRHGRGSGRLQAMVEVEQVLRHLESMDTGDLAFTATGGGSNGLPRGLSTTGSGRRPGAVWGLPEGSSGDAQGPRSGLSGLSGSCRPDVGPEGTLSLSCADAGSTLGTPSALSTSGREPHALAFGGTLTTAEATTPIAAAGPALRRGSALSSTDQHVETAFLEDGTLDGDSDLGEGDLELNTLDCSVQAMAAAAADADGGGRAQDAAATGASFRRLSAPLTFQAQAAEPLQAASRLPQVKPQPGPAGTRKNGPGPSPFGSVPEPVSEINPEALAELASRLRSRSFKEGLAGSFTYRPSRMMPPTHHRSPRPQAGSLTTAPAATVSRQSGCPDSAAGVGPPPAMAATAAERRASHAAELPAAPLLVPPRSVLCVKWLDYSSKYGLTYLLSNGAVGVLFRDGTQLVQEQGAAHAWLLGQLGGGRGSTLLQPQPLPRQAQPVPLDDTALFADGSELVLRELEDEVDFLASSGQRHTGSVRAARMGGPKNSVAKRLQYATALLHARSRRGT
ncbi:hypothetical protein GPECTOR_1g874 [Gonium pectorale]|uniref:Protein kinase domain-containing protein n=1 Tax=Gonium pectorale TaxID=33097 RepID=A0A150H548_GONPE|nr:hypothetical protein GPECTOR_1g874 [Gonium pectorale]|eukprot:KXZ56968.1 hypothetical protein GPECTOR_1g874 [Gonium pectorale]